MTGNASEARLARNLYDVLQVSPSASQEVIHAAYRALARAYHPDVNPTPEAAQRMLKLNAAHDSLGDTDRRARYDLRLTRLHRSTPAFPALAPTVGMRGRPPPQSPRRIEEQRAVGVLAAPTWTPSRQRIALALVLIVVLMVVATFIAWLATEVLDAAPETLVGEQAAISWRAVGSAGEIEPGSVMGEPAQPFLNHA